MIQFIFGLLIGGGVGLLTGKVYFSQRGPSSQKAEAAYQLARFQKRNRELEAEMERLQEKVRRFNRTIQTDGSHKELLQDDLAELKRKLAAERAKNQKLATQLQEYRDLCSSYENRLNKYER